jgi:hypothetical protein
MLKLVPTFNTILRAWMYHRTSPAARKRKFLARGVAHAVPVTLPSWSGYLAAVRPEW